MSERLYGGRWTLDDIENQAKEVAESSDYLPRSVSSPYLDLVVRIRELEKALDKIWKIDECAINSALFRCRHSRIAMAHDNAICADGRYRQVHR